jgi:NAD(P)-dependent dehydrogenase (short-subunit alcohol dehydrogenase family)
MINETTSSDLYGSTLRDQTVVVIGGSAGIGLETARRARAEGAKVILTARNAEPLERAARCRCHQYRRVRCYRLQTARQVFRCPAVPGGPCVGDWPGTLLCAAGRFRFREGSPGC